MKLKLTNEQKLILSQKMQQSLKLLQMNSHELETHDDGSGHNVAHDRRHTAQYAL